MNVFDLMATVTLDTSGFKKGISDVSRDVQKTGQSMGKITDAAKKVGTSMNDTAGKTSSASQSIGKASDIAKKVGISMNSAAGQAAKAGSEFAEAGSGTETFSAKTEGATGKVGIFGRAVQSIKDRLGNLRSEEQGATETSSHFSETLKAVFANDMLQRGIDGIISGVKQLGSAFVSITKQALQSYSDTQQMWGGIQKLYGNGGASLKQYAKDQGKSVSSVREEWQRNEKAQNIVLKNANSAYKTSGMSANQYMESATNFAAVLVNNLHGNTQKAAKQTDVAMRAISDNINTFGTDAESVNYTFQSLSRGNYAMLDNLKLGKTWKSHTIAQYKPCENGEKLMIVA